jgi:hypothetical protein
MSTPNPTLKNSLNRHPILAGCLVFVMLIPIAYIIRALDSRPAPRTTPPIVDHMAEEERCRDAVAALDAWWKDVTFAIKPTKAGTVTPAHTFTYKGRTRDIPRHVQTKAEEAEEISDAKWAVEHRALVQRFTIKGNAVVVMTTLTRQPVADLQAEQLCHELGGFVWANENWSKYGLENIQIVGSDGTPLAGREGLKGNVHGYR